MLELYGRLKEKFEKALEAQADVTHRDVHREGKTLGGAASTAGAPLQRPVEKPAPVVPRDRPAPSR